MRLIADAVELQHYSSAAANLVRIPGTDRVIAIGTPADIALLLDLGPGFSNNSAEPDWEVYATAEYDHSEGGHHD